jgi:putative PIN family toxin of toxin-antitoxin system
MVRLVLDTDVMVAAVTSATGASRALLRKALAGDIELAVSTGLFLEYEAVLLRPARLAAASAHENTIVALLDAVAAIAAPVALDYRWRPSGADPDDELVLESAVNGYADGIATFNVRHLRMAGRRFGPLVDRPGPLLRRIAP